VHSRPSGSVLTPQLHTRADEPDHVRPHGKVHNEDHTIEASTSRIPMLTPATASHLRERLPL
jgi:hypothetical protein